MSPWTWRSWLTQYISPAPATKTTASLQPLWCSGMAGNPKILILAIVGHFPRAHLPFYMQVRWASSSSPIWSIQPLVPATLSWWPSPASTLPLSSSCSLVELPPLKFSQPVGLCPLCRVTPTFCLHPSCFLNPFFWLLGLCALPLLRYLCSLL